ncbi:MAG: hypothetical protein P8X42_01360 [Calditrichaceae bacterium]
MCTSQESARRESGWREFLDRYKAGIYNSITKRCLNWNVPRLRSQLSDVVNDIASEVFTILFKSLEQYQELENEQKFIAWLNTICNRAASHYLRRQFLEYMSDVDPSEMHSLLGDLSVDNRWEIYDNTVSRLRELNGGKKRNLERDINIFHLYVWSDFSDEMIQFNPCYKDIGHRVVDNVVNRMRNQLKK